MACEKICQERMDSSTRTDHIEDSVSEDMKASKVKTAPTITDKGEDTRPFSNQSLPTLTMSKV